MYSWLKKLGEFIRWKIWDFKNPIEKRPFGITVFCGLPGSGKTLALVDQLNRRKKDFPKCKIYTNFGYNNQDGELTDWQQLVDINNGTDGVIFGLDEVHSFFGRNDWQKMPPAILSVFSQNRKVAKEFICTAQAFADVVVDMRRRTHYVIDVRNVLNRWIICRGFTTNNYPVNGENENTLKPRKRVIKYSFIADNDVYNAYDTYKVIESLRDHMSIQPKDDKEAAVDFVVRKISGNL